MNPADKCRLWMAENPEKCREIVSRAMGTFGFTEREARDKMKKALWWLEKNGHKANVKRRRAWAKYLMNFMEPKYDHKKRIPDGREGQSGEITNW